MTEALEDWLEAWIGRSNDVFVFPETFLEEAYQLTSDSIRAHLKLTIARHMTFWGQQPARSFSRSDFAAGFVLEETQERVPFLLLVCPASYAYPTCLLAALMPAVCANVPCIVPVLIPVGQQMIQPSATSLFTAVNELRASFYELDRMAHWVETENFLGNITLACALELVGCNTILTMGLQPVIRLLTDLSSQFGHGRVLFLGEDFWGEDFFIHAARLQIPCVSLFTRPRSLSVETKLPATLFSGRDPLVLSDSVHKNVWFWPQVTLSWFYNRSFACRALEEPCLE